MRCGKRASTHWSNPDNYAELLTVTVLHRLRSPRIQDRPVHAANIVCAAFIKSRLWFRVLLAAVSFYFLSERELAQHVTACFL